MTNEPAANTPAHVYLEQARRVYCLIIWLEEVAGTEATSALDLENTGKVRKMIARLLHVELELRSLLKLLSGYSDAEIDNALDNGGQGND